MFFVCKRDCQRDVSRRFPLVTHPRGTTKRHAIQPATECGANVPRIFGQQQERRLRRIFGFVAIVQNPPTDVVDHPPMSPHEQLERIRIARLRKAKQQFGIRRSSTKWHGTLPQVGTLPILCQHTACEMRKKNAKDRILRDWKSQPQSLRRFDRHGHDYGHGSIWPFHEVDALDNGVAFRHDHEVANLLPA